MASIIPIYEVPYFFALLCLVRQYQSAPAGGSASKFIKDDKDMVLATYAGLAVVVILANLITGGKKEDKPAPMASSSKPTASSDGMPGLDTPAFEEWVAKPGNFEKIFDMLEQE
eukprot:743058-Amorphochlora_amoeboformis.AAC.1